MNKLCRCVLLLILLLPTQLANAEVTIFQNGASPFSMGLADEEMILLPPEYWIEETEFSFVFSAGVDGPYGFYDKTSGCLHPAEFDSVDDYYSTDPDAPVLVGKDGYYGYVNRHNTELAIPLIYQSLHDFSEFENGYAIIGKEPFTLSGGNGYVLLDHDGKEISFPSGYEPYVLPIGDRVAIVDPATGLLGWANLEGVVIIPPEYEGFGEMSEGYISYCQGGKWGHMDASGTIILPPTFELYYDEEDPEGPWGYYFEGGIATLRLVSEDEGWQEIQIDYEGNCIP